MKKIGKGKMKFIKLVKTLSVCLVFISNSTIAGDVSPSSKPFQDLQDQIDVLVQQLEDIESPTSSDATTFMVHSNNKEVGYFKGFYGDNFYARDGYLIVSSNGYMFSSGPLDGTVSTHPNPYFTTTDCSGPLYVYMIPSFVFHGLIPNGGGEEAWYYTPKEEVPLAREFNSQYAPSYTGATDFECRTIPTFSANYLGSALPFDEDVTGFSLSIFNSEFALDLPLTIEKK